MRALSHTSAFFLACVAALVAASIAAKQSPGWPEEIVVGSVSVLLTMALTVAFLRWDRKRFDDIGLAPDRLTPVRFIIGLAVGFTLVGLHVAMVASTGHVHWVLAAGVTPVGIGTAVLGYVLLAFREELAFRGYPLRTLAPAFGATAAQLIVMAVFVAEHRLGGATWSNAIFGAGLGALVFGMAALATRGLALPLGLHAAWNLGDWARGGKGESGLWMMRVDDGYATGVEMVAMTGYAAIMLLALATFWVLYRRRTATTGH